MRSGRMVQSTRPLEPNATGAAFDPMRNISFIARNPSRPPRHFNSQWRTAIHRSFGGIAAAGSGHPSNNAPAGFLLGRARFTGPQRPQSPRPTRAPRWWRSWLQPASSNDPQMRCWQSLADVRFTPISDCRADIAVGLLRAMCGRLRVGKSFLHVCSIGRCSHVFGLFARFT